MELPGVVVHFVYKLPAEQFLHPPLGSRSMPHIVIGNFNSHNTLWGYTSTDNDGEAVELWAESNNLSLIHNVKLPKSFNSDIWKKGCNTDLIFASSNISNMCDWTQFTEDTESAFAQTTIPTNIHPANRMFTNIILMADKHNIPNGKMHSNCRLLPDYYNITMSGVTSQSLSTALTVISANI